MQLGLKWASHGSCLRQPFHRRNRSLQPPPFPANLADIHGSSRKKANNRRTPLEEGYISGIR
ncbi:BnaC02g48510D [Brassica napus]|uniref:BnaC02g48510D protein n=1 Tax=Brassica napus TaxID=3708 RepID=A0A078J3X8_BRANA|nr:BnaC02g48510D [Brassica napus]